MKPRPLSSARLSFPLASAIAALLAAPAVSAADYYWDNNGTTAGFGGSGGTWAAPTPGPTTGWTTDSNGLATVGSVTTSTSDDLFFGSNYWSYNAATSISVTGTVDAGNLTFAAGANTTLSGGAAINLAATSSINSSSFNSATIATPLTGAGTSLTKNGFGPLTLTGASAYTGATILNGQGLITLSGATGGINATSGITFNGTTLTLTNAAGQGAVDRLSTGTITSNGGVLNYGNANTAANTYAETVGTLALTTGQFNAVLTANLTTADGQTLTFGDLTRSGASNTSAITFSANGTGPQASGNKNMFVVTGKGSTTGGQIIGSWATTGIGNSPASQSDYAVYNSDYVVPANIGASTEDTWLASTDAYTSSGSTALSGNRAMAALRNTAGATITLSDAVTGFTLATNGILNGAGSLLTIAEGSVPGSVTAPGVSGGQIHLTAGSSTSFIAVNAPVNDNGAAVTLVKNGVGTLTLTSTTSNYSGGTVINSGALNFANGTLGGGAITINGGSSGASTFGRLQWAIGNTQDISSSLTMVNGGNANIDTNGNTIAFANAVGSNTSSNLTKVGTGQLTLDANNTYTGETGAYAGTLLINVAQTATTSVRISNGTANGGAAGATLKLGADNVLPTSIPVIVDGQSQNFLDLNGFNQTIGHLSLGSNNGGSSGTVTGTGTSKLTITDGITSDAHNQSVNAGGLISVPFLDLNGATQNLSVVGFTNATRGALTISSVIQNGGINRTGSVAGIVSLSGANTFSGATTISVGVLRLDNSLALQNSAIDTTASVAGGADNGLRLNTGVTAVTLGGLNGNKNFAASGGIFSSTTNNYASVTALTLNPLSGTASYSGVIANGAAGMSLTKTGGGTQILANSNTYTGATAINGGTLVITGATQDTSAITFGGGVLGLDTATTVAAAAATVDFTGQSVLVSGATGAPSYTLLTALSITGTAPTLAAPAPAGYELQVVSNQLLLVQVGGSAYDTWAAAEGLTGAPGFENGKGDDPDKDGMDNLSEFAFDGNPLSGANDGKVVGKVATVGADQVMTLTLPVRGTAAVPLFSDDGGDRLSALTDGIYYRVEGSVNLSAFANTITEVTGPDAVNIQAGLPMLATGWSYRTFRDSGTVPTVPKTFLRVKISETP